MKIKKIAPQIRTTDMDATIRFYTEVLGFKVEFNYEDFYVGISSGDHIIHLKLVNEKDPSIPYVEHGGHLHLYFEIDDVTALADELKSKRVPIVEDVHETAWQTREMVLHDDQGHTLYFGESIRS
jgi:catechol 2,3-dioxygenase-like lactoylglutathione lyase family enzyme